MDSGVVPAVVQSDNEFVSLAMEELTSLLGSSQIFSTALRPQSQGIVERSHRDIRNTLAILVEALVRSNPRSWPKLVRYCESKARHKSLATGVTPYALIHGFSGSTALSSAIGAFEEIPQDLVHTEWLAHIRAEAAKFEASQVEAAELIHEERARKHAETTKHKVFKQGQLVLLHRPFYERGTGAILPQSDGPYKVSKAFDPHTCTLEDALTGEPYYGGRPVSTARLVSFEFPEGYDDPNPKEVMPENEFERLNKGDMVAVEIVHHSQLRIYVARVEKTYQNSALVQVQLFRIPSAERYGPWQRRRWELWGDEQNVPYKETLSRQDVLCKVELVNSALTLASLEKLASAGVSVGSMPTRDATLPPRVTM